MGGLCRARMSEGGLSLETATSRTGEEEEELEVEAWEMRWVMKVRLERSWAARVGSMRISVGAGLEFSGVSVMLGGREQKLCSCENLADWGRNREGYGEWRCVFLGS